MSILSEPLALDDLISPLYAHRQIFSLPWRALLSDTPPPPTLYATHTFRRRMNHLLADSMSSPSDALLNLCRNDMDDMGSVGLSMMPLCCDEGNTKLVKRRHLHRLLLLHHLQDSNHSSVSS